MFPNLEALQKKYGHTDTWVAKQLGLSQQAYERKKQTGTLRLMEAQCLMVLYDVDFELLFDKGADESLQFESKKEFTA